MLTAPVHRPPSASTSGLRWVFGFIGIANPEIIAADGIQVGPEHREKAVAGALQAATNLHAA
jgi:FMN-dependent NADH-azoreductase